MRKPDALRIERFVDDLAGRLSLDERRSSWTKLLFHTTELHNAVSILESGVLLSREQVGVQMRSENAQVDIIQRTSADLLARARLYFRPRTPMSYVNEGFRSKGRRDSRAYCPMPVVLAFPSKPILTLSGTRFSDGNCAVAHTGYGETAEFLESLRFEDIYHDTRLPDDVGRLIHHRRQSEVHPPGPLDLATHLPFVGVRSPAERETLLSMLSGDIASRFEDRIRVPSRTSVFYGAWSYVETVTLVGQQLTIRFNEDTSDLNDFCIRVRARSLAGAQVAVFEEIRNTVDPWTLRLRGAFFEQKRSWVEIELDDDLAYRRVLDPIQSQLVGSRG